MKLAIFDFDGTIYKKETFQLLMQQLKEAYPQSYRRFHRSILPIYIGYKLHVVKEEKMKAVLMEKYCHALIGMPNREIDNFFSTVAEKMTGDFNQTVLNRLGQHKQDDYYTIILSGAFTYLLLAIDQQLELNCDRLIGTDFPTSDGGFTHVHAEKKVDTLYHYLPDSDIDWKNSYAYGDTVADIPVLELVGHPVGVNPDTLLEQTAKRKDWEII